MFSPSESGREPASAVVVCGAGAAGISTALSAARSGANVWLIEKRRQIGGTVTHSLIHTLAGLFDSRGEFLNDGLVVELVDRLQLADASVRRRKIGRTWVLNCRPQTYARVVKSWIAELTRIRVHCGTDVVDLEKVGDRIEYLEIASADGRYGVAPSEVVDATGSAELIRRIDPTLVEDGTEISAGGFIFSIRSVSAETLRFPGNLLALRELQAAAERGELPPECRHTWIDLGVDDDEAYVKLMVPMRNNWRLHADRLASAARRNGQLVLNVLKKIPGFHRAEISHMGELGVRDGGRVRGEYRLTVADVRVGRRFLDAACRCEWPIEFWHPDRGVSLEYLPSPYEIPLRCLKVANHENVWVAGKCLSADRDSHASARVVGSCWAMGDALGKAIAAKASVTC